MRSIIISTKKKSNFNFLISLMKKLGIPFKILNKSLPKNWMFAGKIEAGMKTQNVSRKRIMKVLEKQ